MTLLAPPVVDVLPLPENRSAARAVRRLATALTRPKRGRLPFNPLVLHGPTGTGKTALVGELVRAVTAATGHTVRVVAANDIDPRPDEDDSLAGLRECDLLVIEDVQHLAERAADFAERLLDARTARRRATVLTANVGPAVLKHLPRRLTSRVSAGLVVPLVGFSPASRLKLLTFHADRLRVRLADDAARWLADQSPGGFRPLLGMLNTLKATVRPLEELSRDDVIERLADAAKPTDAGDIIAAVAAAFGVTAKEIRGSSRLKTVALARQVAIYLARVSAKRSLPAIGREFGRDHSTVLHAVRKVEELLAKDEELAGVVRELRSRLD
jgi:chromosomal replication initiator protein